MSRTQMLFSLTFVFLLAAVSHAAKVTVKNNCTNIIWPATHTNGGNPLSTTGFELPPKVSATIELPSSWNGRFWARTRCTTDSATGRFSCATGDCSSSGVACKEFGSPPSTLVEMAVGVGNGMPDFYDISNVDGFNLPVSVAPSGGSSQCKPSSCPADINAVCPQRFAVKASDSEDIIGCKSACFELKTQEFCCTGVQPCPPTQFSLIFKEQCPQAYSYALDDQSSIFTCSGEPDYVITFCP